MIGAIAGQSFSFVSPLLVFAGVGIFLLWLRNILWAASPAPPEIAAGGMIAVPVRGLYLRRAGIFGGDTSNSINPLFAIGPDSISYRVFRRAGCLFPRSSM